MPLINSIVEPLESEQDQMTVDTLERFRQQHTGIRVDGVVSLMHPKYWHPVPVEPVTVAEVLSRKRFYAVVNELNEKIPWSNRISHISRVSNMRIIIATMSLIASEIMKTDEIFWTLLTVGEDNNNVDRTEFVRSIANGTNPAGLIRATEIYLQFKNVSREIFELLRINPKTKGVVFAGNVPRYRPLLEWQHTLSRRHWPCEFEDDPIAEKKFNNTIYSEEDMAFHKQIMRAVNYVADFVNPECAMAVNPNTRNVIGLEFNIERIAGDEDHNSHHSPVRLLKNLDKLREENEQGFVRQGVLKNMRDFINKDYKHITFSTALTDAEADKEGPYWPITGYDVYLSKEPCPMCVEALARHDRVMSIFYDRGHYMGGLGSFYRNFIIFQPFDILKSVYRVMPM